MVNAVNNFIDCMHWQFMICKHLYIYIYVYVYIYIYIYLDNKSALIHGDQAT